MKPGAAYWWRVAALLSWTLIVTVMLVFAVAMVAILTDPGPGWAGD